MSRDPTTDGLTLERWADLAAAAELPVLDATTRALALAGASGPGDALLRLVVEAIAVRRRRTPRVTKSAAGERATIWDPLADVVPPGVSRAVVAAERRRACGRIARAVRYHLGLPLATLAPALGVPPRTLQRWARQHDPENGADANVRSPRRIPSAHQPRSAA
jgi:hypothetical protein